MVEGVSKAQVKREIAALSKDLYIINLQIQNLKSQGNKQAEIKK